MSLEQINEAKLEEIVLKILREKPEILIPVIQKVLAEKQIMLTQEKAEKREKLSALIDADFEKYDEVFKALA